MTLVSNAIGAIKNWWWFIIKGILLLIAGVAILSRPVEGYISLSLLLSLVIIGVGASQLFFSISNKNWLPGWGWTLVSGIIDIGVGFFLLSYPAVTMTTLPFFVGFWLMIRSFYIMGASFDLNQLGVSGWGWVLTGGILLLLLSFLVLYFPVAAAAGIVACSGIAFLVAGIMAIMMAFTFRNIKEKVSKLA